MSTSFRPPKLVQNPQIIFEMKTCSSSLLFFHKIEKILALSSALLQLTALVWGVVLYNLRFFFTSGVKKEAVSEFLGARLFMRHKELQNHQDVIWVKILNSDCKSRTIPPPHPFLRGKKQNLNWAKMFEVELVGNLVDLFNPSTTGERADTCEYAYVEAVIR